MLSMGAFARDRRKHKQWWDEHLWLQMVTIAVLCIAVGAVEGVNLVPLLAATAVFLLVVYVVARIIIRKRDGIS